MDNDNAIHRGGFIEGMMDQLKDPNMLATGATMIVSRVNEACGAPHDENDILRYAHPSCAIIKKSMYLDLPQFVNHGAPCCYTMIAAEKKGYSIGSYPIKDYLCHLSGASWCNPRPVWYNDHDVFTRPFVTFVITDISQVKQLENQTDHDFDVQVLGPLRSENVIMHDGEPVKNVYNKL